jgi:hypothetical protein
VATDVAGELGERDRRLFEHRRLGRSLYLELELELGGVLNPAKHVILLREP